MQKTLELFKLNLNLFFIGQSRKVQQIHNKLRNRRLSTNP